MKIKGFYYFSFLLITIFLIISFYLKPSFKEFSMSFPNIPKQLIINEDETTHSFSDYIDEDFADMRRELHKKNGSPIEEFESLAWSLKVQNYSSSEEAYKDFNLLKENGLKAYLRKESSGREDHIILLVGPNINKKSLKEIKLEVSSLLGISGKIIPYQH